MAINDCDVEMGKKGGRGGGWGGRRGKKEGGGEKRRGGNREIGWRCSGLSEEHSMSYQDEVYNANVLEMFVRAIK